MKMPGVSHLSTSPVRLQKAQTVEFHGVHGPKQGRLLVDALAKVCHEGAGNVKALVHDLRMKMQHL